MRYYRSISEPFLYPVQFRENLNWLWDAELDDLGVIKIFESIPSLPVACKVVVDLIKQIKFDVFLQSNRICTSFSLAQTGLDFPNWMQFFIILRQIAPDCAFREQLMGSK